MQLLSTFFASCGVGALGGFLFGYSMAICGIVLVQTSFVSRFCVGVFGDSESCFEAEEEDLPDDWVTFTTQFTALFSLGSMIGAAISGPVSDWWGRKHSMALSALVFALGAFMNIKASTSFAMVLISRLISGVGVGAASCISPVYLAEISRNEGRGVVMAMLPIVGTFGILSAVAVGQFLMNVDDGWIYSLGVSIPLAGLMIIGALLCPESPRWLMGGDRYEEANQALRRLRSTRKVGGEISIKAELMDMAAHAGEKSGKIKLSELFRSSITYRVLLACGIQLFNQFSGIGVVMAYGPMMMNEFEDVNQTFGISFLYFMASTGTIAAAYLVDRLGRRSLYLRGSSGMIIGLLLSGISARLFSLDNISSETSWIMGYMFVGGLGIFMLFYSVSWGALAWVYPVEIFPLQVRAKAVSLSTLCYFFASYLSSYSLEIIHFLGLQTMFYCLATICSCAFYYIYRFAPETKGVRLEDMDYTFDSYRNGTQKRESLSGEKTQSKISDDLTAENSMLLSEEII